MLPTALLQQHFWCNRFKRQAGLWRPTERGLWYEPMIPTMKLKNIAAQTRVFV